MEGEGEQWKILLIAKVAQEDLFVPKFTLGVLIEL